MPRKANINRQTLFEVVGGQTPISIQPTSAGFVPPPPPPALDTITSLILSVNSNSYLIGILYLFLNLGGRFLSLELTKQQEAFLSKPYMRPFILFSVLFIATRNIAVAFWTTLGLLSVIWIFANENHAFCLIPGWKAVDEEKKKEHEKSYEANMKMLKEKGLLY
jgi:hypothetical protein